MLRLEDQVAIVTGGGSGIGNGIAVALAREGVRVVICGRRTTSLDETLKTIKQAGSAGLTIQADISDLADVDQLVNSTLKEFGRIDILINNAGVGGGDQIHLHDTQDWDKVMAINLRGPFLVARAVLPHMRARRQGHIINISSESGLEYYQGDGAYGISKHALNAMGEYIQRENQEFGIRVNTICPGMVVTEMTDSTPGLDHNKCLYPEDIADLVIWLLTRRANIKIGTPILIQTMLNPWE
jgi:NAD(P)-dependent dehydrogenase (short-subunit alcohol dehydrogenase family)